MVYQLVQSGKYRRRLHLFNLKGILQFGQVAAWTENLLFRAGARFTTAYMMLTYGYLMTANNLDQAALTERIIYINPVCDRLEKMYIGIVRLVGAGLSDYSFPT